MRALGMLSVVAFVAAGAPALAAAAAPAGAVAERHALQDACALGRAVACHELGDRALAGAGEPRDARLGAMYLLWACDRGDRTGCARLASLYAGGAGVRRDPARAADLAATWGADPARPPAAFSDAADRPALPAISPADLERQLALVDAYVPRSARAALGLDRDRMAALGIGVPDDRLLVEALVRERVPAVSACVVDRGHGETGVGWIAFVIGGDGRATDVRVSAHGGAAGAEDCLRARVAAWEFPLPRTTSGGLVWLEVVGTLPPERSAAAGVRPRVQGRRPPPGSPPTLQDAGCVRDAMWVHPGSGAPGKVLAWFHVDAAGAVSEVQFLSPVPVDTARALRTAIRDCPWEPARDARGKPVEAWATMPFRLGGE